MNMAKTSKPESMQLFEHLIWANSPKDWVLKSTYFQDTLFVAMLVEISNDGKYKKIRRSFNINIVNQRADDLWGLAADCVDEMKTEIKK